MPAFENFPPAESDVTTVGEPAPAFDESIRPQTEGNAERAAPGDTVTLDHMPALNPSSPENGKNKEPRYKFVFWGHTPENASEAAAELADCDILAFEYAGPASWERPDLQEKYAAVLSTKVTELQRQRALAEVQYLNPTTAAVLRRLPVRDQQIFLLDMGADHESWSKVEAIDQVEQELGRDLVNNRPNAELRRHVVGQLHAHAEAAVDREPLVASQLERIGALPGSAGKLIGYGGGTLHSSIQHKISKTAQTQRVFVHNSDDLPLRPSEKVRFSRAERLIRDMRMHPDRPVPESSIDRLTLEYMLYAYGHYRPSNTAGMAPAYVRHLTMNRAEAELTDKLLDAEVTELLEQFDAAKAALGNAPGLFEVAELVRPIVEAAQAKVRQRRDHASSLTTPQLAPV